MTASAALTETRRLEILRGDWCIEDETRDNTIARRNVLAALWAGELCGLTGPALTAYAVEVHLSDFECAGDSDILAKLERDLAAAGRPVARADLASRLARFHREAIAQTRATD